MVAADNDPGATRVMPAVPPSGGGGRPTGVGNPPPGAGGRPPKGGTPMWLIVLVAVLGGLVAGGVIVWLLMGSPGAVPTALTPGTSTAATPTADAQSATPQPGAEATTAVTPPAPPTTETKPEADTTPPKTPKFKIPPSSYWLSESNMKVEIDWATVSDPSGVSYVLEFSQWLGGGAGWTDATRTAPVKRLYYERTATGVKERYRIIAIDGAGNESDPSAYQFLIQAPSASDAASLNANYTP
jgi:hypothetical protein